jgi:hypothetical protein
MNKITKHLITATLTIVLLAIQFQTSAATVYTSTGSGNWTTSFSSTGTGNPIVYKILSTHVIDVNVSNTSAIDSLLIFGTLNFNNGKKVDLSGVGIISIYTGGSTAGGNGGSKFRFIGSTDIPGPFATTGPAFADATTGGAFITGSLPVSWLNIELVQTTNIHTITWSTAQEKNNNYFNIQLSVDGYTWYTLTSVESKAPNGNSSSILSYSADINMPNGSKYVRIKQVDFDGENDYSRVLKIQINQPADYAISYLSNHTIRVTNNTDSETILDIYNIQGEIILTQSLDSVVDLKLPKNNIYILRSNFGFVQKFTLY